MSEDSAFATLLYDTRKGKKEFSREVCNMMGVDMGHLPEICRSVDMVGTLTEKAAEELGLLPGTPVFAGGGDASLIGVGAGAVSEGDTHIYMGTSGWVSTVVSKQTLSMKKHDGFHRRSGSQPFQFLRRAGDRREVPRVGARSSCAGRDRPVFWKKGWSATIRNVSIKAFTTI